MEDDLDDAQSVATMRARRLGDRTHRGRCRRGRHTSGVREGVARCGVLGQERFDRLVRGFLSVARPMEEDRRCLKRLVAEVLSFPPGTDPCSRTNRPVPPVA